MNEPRKTRRFVHFETLVVSLWALLIGGPAAASDMIDNAYDLLVAMGQAYQRSYSGINNLTEFQEPKDIGFGQEITRRCEKDAETGECVELHPNELKRLEAEATSGKSRADLAAILERGADGAYFAGIMLEFGMAAHSPLGMLWPSAGLIESSVPDTADPDDPLYVQNTPLGGYAYTPIEARCRAAEIGAGIKHGRGYARPATVAAAHISPSIMMTQASCMLMIAAQTLTADQEYTPEGFWATDELIQAIGREVVYHGHEMHGDLNLHRISLDNPGFEDSVDGHQLTINRIERWIHVERLYEVKTRMTGVLSSLRSQVSGRRSGTAESRQIFIEREFGDFRRLPGTEMYHPFRSTSRIGGFFNEDEMAEMRQAAEKLDEYERQLAGMSLAQRQQMEQMMGGRIAQMRTLAESGTFEFTLITKRVLINTDAQVALSGWVPYELESLTQEIQYNLQALGYDVGNTDGAFTKATALAIIRFQNDYGLELNGRPTPELARIVSATMSAVQ